MQQFIWLSYRRTTKLHFDTAIFLLCNYDTFCDKAVLCTGTSPIPTELAVPLADKLLLHLALWQIAYSTKLCHSGKHCKTIPLPVCPPHHSGFPLIKFCWAGMWRCAVSEWIRCERASKLLSHCTHHIAAQLLHSTGFGIHMACNRSWPFAAAVFSNEPFTCYFYQR